MLSEPGNRFIAPPSVRLACDWVTGLQVNRFTLILATSRSKIGFARTGTNSSWAPQEVVSRFPLTTCSGAITSKGAHIVLVDVGHSYKGLCDLVKGYYFTYQETNPIKFNPFHIVEGDSLDTEKKESIKTLILALWKKDNEAFKQSEYVALSNALTLYYAYIDEYEEFAFFNTFYEFLRDEFVPILDEDKVKDRDFDVAKLLYVLRPYYKGGKVDYLLKATEKY